MKKLLLFFTLFTQSDSFAQDCKGLPLRFSSTSEAINRVKNSVFVLTDRLPEGKSPVIVSANYYSCDGESGYLVYVVGKRARSFIHAAVPKRVWLEFKNAVSGEVYYDSHIRDKYPLELKQTSL